MTLATKPVRLVVVLATAIVVTGSLGFPGAGLGPDERTDPAGDPGGGLAEASQRLDDHLPVLPDPLADRARVQQSQLETARGLVPLIADLDAVDDDERVDRSLDVAAHALAQRTALVDELGPDTVVDGLAQQAATLDATRSLVDAHGTQTGLELARAHVQTVTDRQAHAIHAAPVGVDHAPPPPAFAAPSQAVEAIAERQGVAVPEQAREGLAALDGLDEPTRSALLDVLASYLAFDAAVEDAFEDVGPGELWTTERPTTSPLEPANLDRPVSDPPGALSTPAQRVEELGLDLSAALSARLALLDRVDGLDRTLEQASTSEQSGPDPVRVPGAVAIDLAGQSTTYTADYAVQLDVGGDDTYRNNAGGSNLDGGGCTLEEAAGAAMLVDLAGDDVYGGEGHRRGCGANGGAYTGAGLLVDASGSDRFVAAGAGTNGGGLAQGLGLLVSVGGDDVFDAYSFGTNGGGNEALGALVSTNGLDTYDGGSLGSNGAATGSGVGVLVDGGGADVYEAGIIGANGAGDGYILGTGIGQLVDLGDRDDVYLSSGGNGGGSRKGVGFLFDGGGSDRFLAHAFGTNGGGQAQGVGLLVSAGGGDTFEGDYNAVNGGATSQGVGLLVNLGSDSTYGIHAEDSVVKPGTRGFNGGAADGGVALLVDGGASTFEATSWAVNGGATNDGVSLVLSGDGADTFEAESIGANAGASGGTALLVELGGADTYRAEDGATNGGAEDEGLATLVDRDGADTYLGDGGGSNGGADSGGYGMLVDERGDDVYRAGSGGANGHAEPLSFGLLLDGGGHDYYEDGEGGTGWDETVVPKGAVGAQIDQEAIP